MGKLKWLTGMAVVLLAGMAVATDVLFTGSNSANNLFSETNNWASFPVAGDNILIAANGTSISNPASLDAAFDVDFGTAKIYSGGAGGTGMSSAEVASGATLKATIVYVGNAANQYFDGDLTVRSGGTVGNRYLNSGLLSIGGADVGEDAVMTIESGASVSHTLLKLNPFGTLTFEFGADSVSTFTASRTTAGGANTLDGLLQVDFGALTTVGSYTLVDSSSTNLLLAGALYDDLLAAGGSITNGSQSMHFNVLNEGNVTWSLATADSGQDLVLHVLSLPLPDPEAVRQTLALASITYAAGDSSNAVTADVSFSTTTVDGASLSWSPSLPLIIGVNGTVYRPRAAPCFRDGVIPLTVTATASRNGVSDTRDFLLQVLPSVDSGDPSYMGAWLPFWRAMPVIGEWMAGGQGMEEIQDYQKQNSFCVQTKALAAEVTFADHLNAVRLIGGWNADSGSEKPNPADEADLVYKDEFGGLQYRWDRLAGRLDPYIHAGYTNLTLVLDNIPYCFTTNHVMESYGQVGAPDDFAEWHTFVSNLCSALVDLYGFETANGFRFRQGTEAQSVERFAGTQEDYFKIYDHSAAAVKSILPGAEFGPFNAAGGINSGYNVKIKELARHCATGTNYATGGIGSPFDFIPISFYQANASQATLSPEARVSGGMGTLETIQSEFPEPRPYEIHEFGILRSGTDLPSNEPGARGAAYCFHVIGGFREQGVSRWCHWGIFDTFRSSSGGLHKLLHSTGWFLSLLDRTVGGEAFVLNTSDPVDSETAVKAIGVFGGERGWVLAGAYNPDRLSHDPEVLSVRVPTNLLQITEGDTVLWTSLNQTNSAHWMIRRDLESQGMLNADFSAVPEQLAAVRTMTTNAVLSPEQDYLGGRIELYEQAVIDSLTLKPFPGTVSTNGGELVFSLILTPPETAVICIGPDQTADGIPFAWLDQYGLATNGYKNAATTDSDGDSLSAAQEYIIQTDPLESNPSISIQSWMSAGGLSFQTLENRLYNVYSTDSLIDPDWQSIGEPMLGTGAVKTLVDPQQNSSNRFYRFELTLP